MQTGQLQYPGKYGLTRCRSEIALSSWLAPAINPRTRIDRAQN